MNDKDRILLMFGWSTLLLGIIVLMCKVTFRMDQLDKKLNVLAEELAAVPETVPTPEVHTVTDAVPEEPSDDEIIMSVRPELSDASESVQNASEMTSEEITEQIDLEELKAVPEASRTFLGVYELTAYEWTGNPCANGNYPSCGYTVACNSLPLGSRIYIEGYGEYVVEDRGGMADNVIDMYMGDYDTCIQFGRQTANVYLVE